MPQNISSLVVYINQDLFEQAGLEIAESSWSWEQLLFAAEKISDLSEDVDGVGIEPSLYRFAPFIWQTDGTLIDQNSVVLPASAPNLSAIGWLIELQTEYQVTPSQLKTKSLALEERFISGQLGMLFESRRLTPTLRQVAKFNWDVAPLPLGEVMAGVLHSDGYCLGQSPSAETLAFIRFAVSKEGQMIMAQTGRTVPSLKSVAESSVFLESELPPANGQVWLDGVEHLKAVPWHPNWIEIEKLASAELEQAFYGHITLEEAIARIHDQTETIGD